VQSAAGRCEVGPRADQVGYVMIQQYEGAITKHASLFGIQVK
jgi:hypothetical protein